MGFRSILLTAAAVLMPAVPAAQAAIAPVSLCVSLAQMIEQEGHSDALAVGGAGGAGLTGLIGAQGDDGSYRALRVPRYNRPPRYYHTPRAYRTPIVTQLAIGFYDPSGAPAKSFLMSARIGPQVNPNVQLGLMVDWAHKADRVSSTFGQETIGGVNLSLEDSRLRGSTDLVPMLAFLQLGANDPSRPMPYAGFGAGYEILAMEADQPDGSRFDATFGGWGWQGWIGAGLPLGDQVRVNGEVFYNHVDLERDVFVDGLALRQTADFNGPGMRFGVAWGF